MSGQAVFLTLIIWFAVLGVRSTAAQDSLNQKGFVRPFAVPMILEPEPPPPPRPLPPVDLAALASSTTAALRELQDGIAPEDWRRSHPQEVAQFYRPELALIDGASWCVRFSRRWVLPQGRSISRQAFFFSPMAAGVANPLSKSPGVHHCRLGAVWLTFEEPDTIAGDSLATALRASLASQFPIVSETLPALTRWPARRAGNSWHSSGMLIETAFRESEIVIVSSFPFALEEEALKCYPQCPLEDWGPTAEVDNAISIVRQVALIAALPPARLAPVLGLLAEIRPTPSSDTVFRVPSPRLVAVLRRWLGDSGRSPQQRAATLLVADRLLAVSRSSVDRAAREQLTKLGAGFVDLPSDVLGYGYDLNWRRRAYVLDQDGPVGAVAMAAIIRDNFSSMSTCTAEGYRQVIQLTEPFLTTAVGARSAPAHLALADAYRDMLTLASGGGSESLHPIEWLLRTTPAELLKIRRLALSHYRAAFALDSTSSQARLSKDDAWRVSAGLVPTQTRYACTDD